MSRLESIKLTSFKGASNPITIEFQNNSTFAVIFGENGTCKSTIVDAFDFICNNGIGSLENKSLGTPQKGRYITTINKEPSDLRLELKYSNNEWIGTLGSSLRPTSSGPDGKPDVKILRREKIQALLLSEASKRYEAVKSFIDTPKIDRLYEAVKNLRIQKERDYTAATRALSDAKDALEQLWIRLGRPGNNYYEWAAGEVRENIDDIKEKKIKLENIVSLRTRIATGQSRINDVKQNLESNTNQLISKKVEFDNLTSTESGPVNELIDVLRTADAFYSANSDSETCPVCEQTVVPTEVAQNVRGRLEGMQNFIAIKREIDGLERAIEESKNTLNRFNSAFIELSKTLFLELHGSTIEEVRTFDINFDSFINISDEGIVLEEKLRLAGEFSGELNNKLGTIPSVISALQDKISRYELIKNYLDIINDKTVSAEQLEKVNQRINVLFTIVNNQRNEYVTSVLNSISADIDNMYQKIHPRENIGGIQLVVDPERRASLDIKGNFSTKTDILPQAYYSESHLDTLGICLFIALSKYYRTPDTILILDDVITSADQVHLSRFIRMLEDELPNFAHTIVTTHYQVWRDKYRYGAGNAQIIELLGWSLERGLRHTKTKLYVEELEHYRNIEPMDKQIVASKAGIFLELILDNLALQYQCKLPRKREQNYTLGELLGGFSARLKRNMKVQIVENGTVTQEISLTEKMNVLPPESPIRNQVGCHFNEVGANFSTDDIKEMADKTIDLANALICNDCGELPFRERTGEYYECKCRKKRLYPLTEPTA